VEEQQDGRAISTTFSGDSKRERTIYPGGRIIERAFDAIDRPTSITADGLAVAAHFFIGPGMRELKTNLGNGTVTSYLDDAGTSDIGYDGVRRVVRQRHLLPPGTDVATDRLYTYNRANQRTSELRADDGGATDSYGYDSAYRVIAELLDQGAGGGVVQREVTSRNFHLDGVGNRTTVEEDGASGPASKTYQPNEMNEYGSVDGMAIEHSPRGNRTADASKEIIYDYKNRVVEIRDRATERRIASYTYDALNRRVGKTVFSATMSDTVEKHTLYSYDRRQVVEEHDGETGLPETTYVWGAGHVDRLCQVVRTAAHPLGAATLYTHQNVHFNVVAITDGAGAVVQRRRYDAFGAVSYYNASGAPLPADTTGVDYGFQGRRHDAESGYIYFRARHWDPSLGCFLQRDPVWASGQVGGWQSFPGNNPVSLLDPNGLDDEEARSALGMIGDALYSIFVAPWYDPLSEFIDEHGVLGLFGAVGCGVVAVVTIPIEIFEAAFYSYGDMREDIIWQIEDPDYDRAGMSTSIVERFYEQREQMAEYRQSNPARYEKLRSHFASDTHWKFGYFIQWLTGGYISAWDAMNIWPDGGLTGPGALGVESPGLENVTCAHDSVLNLWESLQLGSGAGFLREGNILSGMVSNFLRVAFSGDYGMTGFGAPGAPGVERPWGSVPGERTPEERQGNVGGWSIFDENYDPLFHGPEDAARAGVAP
jgi:RHS repeat-associated protein